MCRRLQLKHIQTYKASGVHLGKLSRLVLLMIGWENLQFKGGSNLKSPDHCSQGF